MVKQSTLWSCDLEDLNEFTLHKFAQVNDPLLKLKSVANLQVLPHYQQNTEQQCLCGFEASEILVQ